MKVSRSLFIAAALTLLVVVAAQAAPLSGAIFTTTPDGKIVNENVRYEDKRDVYLDGGPGPNAPATAAGLPDGYYVYQITDPSGKFLLSMDPAKCRIVRVAGGVIVERVTPSTLVYNGVNQGLTNTYGNNMACAIDDNPPNPTNPGVRGNSGRHDTNVDADHWTDAHAIVVQMMPYGTTPNPGGVYKAWMTPLFAYDAKDSKSLATQLNVLPKQLPTGQQKPHACPDFCAGADIGFAPPRDQVKTDNFKVKEFFPPEITVRKFHDLNGNGIWDTGEPEIGANQCVDENTGAIVTCPGGWPYDFTEPVDGGTVTNKFYTPYTHIVGVAGTYKACEWRLPGWTQSAAYVDGVKFDANQCVSVFASGAAPGEKHEIIFGNFMNATKSGMKFEDMNGNSKKDAGDNGLAGWTINLTGTDGMGNTISKTTTTDVSGKYTFSVPPGTYKVCEGSQAGWTQTYPSGDGCHYVTLTSGQADTDNDFGNFKNVNVKACKVEDADGNVATANDQTPIPDWTVYLSIDGVRQVPGKLTGSDGCATWLDLGPGHSYDVEEDVPDGWTALTDTKHDFGPATSGSNYSFVFKNFENVEVTACKIKDIDGNLATTDDQSYITGWSVYLSIDGVRQLPSQPTGSDGCYTWLNLGPGHSYDVEEDVPAGWIALTPTEHDFGPATSGATYSFTFINTPLQGCTPGFWQGGNDFGTAGGKWLWNELPDPEWPLSGGIGTNPYIWETPFNSFFTPYGGLSGFDMMSLVGTGGGSDDFQKAARDLVAAYLNASWSMAYAYTPAELSDMWTAAVKSGDFMTLHLLLDAANNAPGGCPISASGY